MRLWWLIIGAALNQKWQGDADCTISLDHDDLSLARNRSDTAKERPQTTSTIKEMVSTDCVLGLSRAVDCQVPNGTIISIPQQFDLDILLSASTFF